ncbi:hypothetical protein [Pararhizobium haloflavum]|uniref:hypothetical protein n=1 Tax=Pararhizobium haloflavum TaxID=2037914 RepID=UPI000C19D811|nr:hypothetical protein [Pararhizobium haloflavum]
MTSQNNGEHMENIAYVRHMLGELRAVAEAEGCAMLCYLIEMAYVEAGDIQLGRRPSRVRDIKSDAPPGVSM